jgi:hypothetical protein
MFGSSVSALDKKGTPAADTAGNVGHIFDRLAQGFPRI